MFYGDVEGSYYSSFFSIYINTVENLPKNQEDILKFMKKYAPTFLHEFIHYLQDLYLPYCIRLNLVRLRWLENIMCTASDNIVSRPFSDWNEDCQCTRAQHDFTWGKGQVIHQICHIDLSEPTTCKVSASDKKWGKREFTLYSYTLLVTTVDKGKIEYTLGARDQLEYIAYKIEKKHFPDISPLPQLPYDSVDILFEKYGLSHISEEMRICIAEACLCNDNPVHYLFIKFLNNDWLKNEFLSQNSYGDEMFYQKLSDIVFRTKDNVVESLQEKIARRLGQFQEDLKIFYDDSTQILNWLDKVNASLAKLFPDKFIFYRIYRMNLTEVYHFIGQVLCAIGIPVIINKEGDCFLYNGDEGNEFFNLIVWRGLLDFMMDSKMQDCPIRKICKKNIKLRCNGIKIFKKEWLNGNYTACPYLKLYRKYNVKNIQIKNVAVGEK